MRFILYHKLIYITLMVGNLFFLGLNHFHFVYFPAAPIFGIPITLLFLTIHIHNFLRIKKKAPYQTLVFEEFLGIGRMCSPCLVWTGYGLYIPLFLSPVSCTWWSPLFFESSSLPKDQFILVFFIIPTLLIIIEYIYLKKLKILRDS